MTLKRYCFDIDGTICTPGEGCGTCQYEGATPKIDRIEMVNKLYDEGHYIIYMTARAMGRNKHKSHEEAAKVAHELLFPLTKSQLKMWGCKYHELIMGKPHADLFIDDKGISDEDFFRKICS
jgi:phosphatidate phosphatase PAH1